MKQAEPIVNFIVGCFLFFAAFIFIKACVYYPIKDWLLSRKKKVNTGPIIEDFEKHYNDN